MTSGLGGVQDVALLKASVVDRGSKVYMNWNSFNIAIAAFAVISLGDKLYSA